MATESDKLHRHIGQEAEQTTVRFAKGRNIVVVIGIDDYANWPKLRNAVGDAIGVQKLLVEKLGFVSPIPPILNKEATGEAILGLVRDKLYDVLLADDSVVIFFAGHGHTRVTKLGELEVESGYIVPIEARTDRWSDYISADTLLKDIGYLPSRHVLMILDACRSGLALGTAIQRRRSAVRYEEDLVSRVSRKVITSARREQDALDSGPIPGHSLFTGMLLEGLNWGTADLDGNNLVTSRELGLYLQQRVGQASESKQTPDYGEFHLDNGGELVISLRDDNFDSVKARAFLAMLRHDEVELEGLVNQLIILRPNSAETLYLRFRLNFMNGEIVVASSLVSQLLELDYDEGAIPLTKGELAALQIQLDFWRPVLSIPSGNPPIQLRMLTGANSESLHEAPLLPCAVGDTYQIDNDAVVRIEVSNLSDGYAHLYYIVILPHGRLLFGPVLESDDSRYNGLAPGATECGPIFQVKGLPGIISETRIFYSPSRVSKLLFPTTTATRAVQTLSSTNVNQLQMIPLWYQIPKGSLNEIVGPGEIQRAYFTGVARIEPVI